VRGNQVLLHARGLAHKHPLGEAQDGEARELKSRVAGAVALEAFAGAMVLEAVELDGDLLFAPQGIDPVAEKPGVRFGPLEACFVHELVEAVLQLGAASRFDNCIGEERAELSVSPSAWAAVGEFRYCSVVEASFTRGFLRCLA
jgi:hypothetical protein